MNWLKLPALSIASIFCAQLATRSGASAQLSPARALGVSPLRESRTLGTVGTSQRLQLAAPEIVWIPAGEFAMGATADDVEHARYLCERDSASQHALAWRCAGVLDSLEGAALGSLCERSNFEYITFREEGQHTVYLSEFGIDRTEVTVRDYWRCVNDGACTSARVDEGSVPFGASDHPVVAVSWYQAAQFCDWRAGRLPTEAQWERAARGRERAVFPWGNLFNPHLANLGMTSATCLSDADGYLYTAPVTAFVDGRSPDGVLNMAGNVSEWVEDAFNDGPEDPSSHRSLWRRSPSRYRAEQRAVNPRVTEARDDRRVFRGGSFASQSFQARTTFRARIAASEQAQWLGFRCAYNR